MKLLNSNLGGGKLFSFDIFDTLLIRACGTAEAIFDILALRILGNSSSLSERADFSLCRKYAEGKARSILRRDPSIDEIYEYADFSSITLIGKNKIRDCELQVESDMLVGVERMRKEVSRCRKSGRICFTSDMHLPSTFLRAILKREGFYVDGDTIFVSSEEHASKADGNLYEIVKKRITFADFHHYGDNYYSDNKMMKRVLHGKYHKVYHDYSGYQRLMQTVPDYNQMQRPTVLASLSKAILLSLPIESSTLFACDLVAPVIVSAVYEILSRAYSDGIRSLYFLARDGKIMYEAAKSLLSHFPGMKIEYVYVSRTSLYLPSIPEVTIEWLESIYSTMRHQGYSIGRYMRTYMPGLNLDKTFEIDSFEKVIQDSELYNKVCRYHTEQRELLRNYFESIGLADNNKNVGVVDLTTSGMTFECINRFLESPGKQRVKGYVYNSSYARRGYAFAGVIDSVTHSDRRYGQYERAQGLGYILEDYFAAADNARTTHYGKNIDGDVVPIFEYETEGQKKNSKEIFSLHSRICEQYAKLYLASGAYIYNDFNISIFQYVLSKYGRNPRKEYVDALCGRSYDDGSITTDILVKKLSLKDLFTLLRTKGKYGSWARGSVVATFGNLGRGIIYGLGILKNIWVAYR